MTAKSATGDEPANDSRLSLCLIARDEEQLLPGCLESVRGVVDDIIVVDTGSQDRTIELAEAAGARVVSQAWNDDFACARNRALDFVHGGYVLILDADERLAPGAGALLRQALAEGGFDCAELPLHNAARAAAKSAEVLSGEARISPPVYLSRLFRWSPDLRWEGIIHEHVTRWAAKHPRRRRLEAPIVHYGATPERVEAREKNARNLRLLERRTQTDPRSPHVWRYYGQELLNAGDRQAALAAVERAWELVELAQERGEAHIDFVGPASLRAHLLVHEDRIDEAEETLRSALFREPEHPNLHYLTGRCHEARYTHAKSAEDEGAAREALARAEACYRSCLDLADHPVAYDVFPGVTDYLAETRLATVELLAGRSGEALQHFETVLAKKPHHVEALLGRLEAWLNAGRAAEVLARVEPLLRPEMADGWILAALAGCAESGFAAVEPIYRQAVRSSETALLLAPHRRFLLRDLGELAEDGAPSRG